MSCMPSIRPVWIVVSDDRKDKSARSAGCLEALSFGAYVLRVCEGSPIIRALCEAHAII